MGEAKKIKHIMSSKKILDVLTLFALTKFIAKPAKAKSAKGWSMSPKSNKVKGSQRKNGSPIISPLRIITK